MTATKARPPAAALAAVYEPLRLYINFFQPVMVLVRKERIGAKLKRYDDEAQTPYQRVLDAPEVADDVKVRLRKQYDGLRRSAKIRS